MQGDKLSPSIYEGSCQQLAVMFIGWDKIYEKWFAGICRWLSWWLGDVCSDVVVFLLRDYPILEREVGWICIAPVDVPANCMGWALGIVILIAHFCQQFICSQFCDCINSNINSIVCILSILRG